MIVGLDSAFPPSPTTVLAAKRGGVGLWSGYISTAPYDGGSHYGLYHPWPREGFEYARLAGGTPIAFCSGWDSPGALKALATAWNVRLCLDVEGGIRADGPWKQPWLNASGAGVYGNDGCHINCSAPFHVRAAYPGVGDVRATWGGPVPRPATPCGWQWAGTHPEFGVTVDRGDYDDWFGGGNMTVQIDPADPVAKDVTGLYKQFSRPSYGNPADASWADVLANTRLNTDKLLATPPAPIDPQVAADLHTIAEAFRKLGIP